MVSIPRPILLSALLSLIFTAPDLRATEPPKMDPTVFAEHRKKLSELTFTGEDYLCLLSHYRREVELAWQTVRPAVIEDKISESYVPIGGPESKLQFRYSPPDEGVESSDLHRYGSVRGQLDGLFIFKYEQDRIFKFIFEPGIHPDVPGFLTLRFPAEPATGLSPVFATPAPTAFERVRTALGGPLVAEDYLLVLMRYNTLAEKTCQEARPQMLAGLTEFAIDTAEGKCSFVKQPPPAPEGQVRYRVSGVLHGVFAFELRPGGHAKLTFQACTPDLELTPFVITFEDDPQP